MDTPQKKYSTVSIDVKKLIIKLYNDDGLKAGAIAKNFNLNSMTVE